MSIPAIPITSTAVRARAPGVEDATPANTPVRARTAAASDEAATKTESTEPAAVHFPWLSRLSQTLEAASNKRPTFPNPIIGDNLDQKA